MEVILKKEIILNKALCRIFGLLTFVILTALGAFVRIPLPFTPVPITLQTFFVLLCGAFLGSGLGALAQLSYIFLGILGIPLFSGTGSGLFYLFGPTAGYLFGFVLASLFIGRFVRQGQDNLFKIFALFFTADLVLLAIGTLWLRFLFGYTFKRLLFIGFLPFLAPDLLKAWFASILYFKLQSRLKEIF
ncbi:MAG: BioY family transporter [Candidatus Omnitrophica bacterium CG08_land_8_20_14_0_20_41_16]|uniref:Biotin transporter n=1 Tax=Candidatus Sherwoodlollariibacterium unditelluris TaxID=1974757 RepID=A0A2G9YI46_9BACT|nr:MAG: BioY family transporter [Candidatus Omnitrophica bacterium CG23_combo_of_CG06-09_8_20_14_all_41_10]PIS34364.1 MAG: BioY family transporter [Candidatus Omnitrophica bacterium CG08_land_8_20_14_0_20_41_16]